jgi:NDP-sugar pyrophosphorylase family protein
MKAMILAAGLGTRLRPLTLERAKPAIPILGKPLVIRLIERLAEEGVKAFRLNLHHLPDTIRSIFESGIREPFPSRNLTASFSFEPEILGTAGGLKANESFFDDELFVMANGDIIVDFPLTEAIAFHRQRNALATLLLYPQSRPYRHLPVRIDEEGRLHNFKGAPASHGKVRPEAYVFTGVHLLSPEIFDFIPPACFSEINDEVYPAAIRSGKAVFGFPVEGYWNDLGNPVRYLEAQKDLLMRSSLSPPAWISNLAEIEETARVGPFVSIGAGCRLERSSLVENAVLWEDVTINSRGLVRDSILGAGVTVPGECCGQIITRSGEVPIVSERTRSA